MTTSNPAPAAPSRTTSTEHETSSPVRSQFISRRIDDIVMSLEDSPTTFQRKRLRIEKRIWEMSIPAFPPRQEGPR